MTSRDRTRALIGAWAICIAMVGGTGFVADRLLPTETGFEQDARAELTRLQRAASAERVVVLGDSRMENATRWEPTLEVALADAGHDVVVANLTAPARRSPHYEPLFDEILEAQPDVVIVPIDIFRLSDERPDRSLSARLRRSIGRDWEVQDLATRGCETRTAAQFEELVEHLGHNLVLLPPANVDRARAFLEQLGASGARVLFVDPPRSARLRARVESRIIDYRTQVIAEFPGEHVIAAPAVDLDDSDYYCDESHLNVAGQRVYLDALVPQIVAAFSPGE